MNFVYATCILYTYEHEHSRNVEMTGKLYCTGLAEKKILVHG